MEKTKLAKKEAFKNWIIPKEKKAYRTDQIYYTN